MRVYYNEVDGHARSWLENLCAAGAIPSGDVDRRSIVDVKPDDLAGYDQCHFFAGIGVWPYALLQAEWPSDRAVWTGSCPCQPFSRSGQRKGFDDERHLWPVWLKLIRECSPSTVFGEQVAGPDGRTWLDRVSADLEEAGFAFGAADLPAAGVGAPHNRPRHFFVASRLGHTEGLHEKRDFPVAEPSQKQEFSHRGASAPRRTGAVGLFWANADFAGCRDGWRRAVEPGTRPLAPRNTDHMVKMRAYGNALVAPLAAEFVGAYLDVDASNHHQPDGKESSLVAIKSKANKPMAPATLKQTGSHAPYAVQDLPLSGLVRRSGARRIQPGNIEMLAGSMAELGLINPVTVRRLAGQSSDAYEIIAGVHRVEAAKKLGWSTILAVIVDETDEEAELKSIDENLCRTNLSPAARAEWTAKRKQLYLAMHPETARGGPRVVANLATTIPNFTDATARKTGQSKRAIRRDAERGQLITPAAMTALMGTSLDNGIYLDKLKKMPLDAQASAVAADLEISKLHNQPITVSAGKAGNSESRYGSAEAILIAARKVAKSFDETPRDEATMIEFMQALGLILFGFDANTILKDFARRSERKESAGSPASDLGDIESGGARGGAAQISPEGPDLVFKDNINA